MTHCPRCGKDNAADIHSCTPQPGSELALILEQNAQLREQNTELDFLVHDHEVQNRELKAHTDALAGRISDLYKQLNAEEKLVDDLRRLLGNAVETIRADEALLAQALEALEHHTAIKHPAQIPYRDRTIALLRTRLAPTYTPTPNEGSEP
jgi:hypothetical protein